MRSAARERGNGVRARSWVAERIATGIATGLLTTKRYTPAHSGNLGVEILNEIGVEATRRNALGRPQRFPKPKVGGSSPLGTANAISKSFHLNNLDAGLPPRGVRFATPVFSLRSLRFAIPLSASRLRSASSV